MNDGPILADMCMCTSMCSHLFDERFSFRGETCSFICLTIIAHLLTNIVDRSHPKTLQSSLFLSRFLYVFVSEPISLMCFIYNFFFLVIGFKTSNKHTVTIFVSPNSLCAHHISVFVCQPDSLTPLLLF